MLEHRRSTRHKSAHLHHPNLVQHVPTQRHMAQVPQNMPPTPKVQVHNTPTHAPRHKAPSCRLCSHTCNIYASILHASNTDRTCLQAVSMC
jgi:hypothetical protein